MLNLYCLFHKCGNNYVQNVHRLYRSTPFVGTRFVKSVQPTEAKSIHDYDRWFRTTNVRCRNFGFDTLKENNLLDIPNVRLLIFTRHPASFILSATKYHLRGGEHWAANEPQPHFGGIPITQALQTAKDEADQHIVIMEQFKHIYERQASLMQALLNENAMRVKCEDLFTTTSEEYFQDIADFLRLGRKREFVKALKAASPAFRESLPKHSTGAFQTITPYNLLGAEAQLVYDRDYKGFEEALGY